MELSPFITLPPHDVAVEYRSLINELYSGERPDKERREYLRRRQEELTEQYSFSYIPFTENGMKGLKCYTGEIVVEAKYDDFSLIYSPNDDEFPCETLMAIRNGKCGVVSMDGSGRELTEFIFDNWNYLPGFYMVSIGDKCGVVSEKDGRFILPCEYDEIRRTPGFEAFYKNGLHGFLVHTGPDEFLVTAAVYSSGKFNENGNLTVLRDGAWGYIDRNGDFTTDESLAFIKKDKDLDALMKSLEQKYGFFSVDDSDREEDEIEFQA